MPAITVRFTAGGRTHDYRVPPGDHPRIHDFVILATDEHCSHLDPTGTGRVLAQIIGTDTSTMYATQPYLLLVPFSLTFR